MKGTPVRLLMLSVAAVVGAAEEPLSLIGRGELVCPVCGQVFQTVVSTQSNTREGIDYDLFARALGAQPEYYRISTCPNCGYSGYPADFDPAVPLPADVRERILRELRAHVPADFTPASDPRELDAADRYRLAILCYRWRQKPDEALAWLHLRASWIARDEGAVLPREPRLAKVLAFVERWRPDLEPGGNQVDVEMRLAARIAEAIDRGAFNRYQRPFVELALALILRRHGENEQAGPMLERLAALDIWPAALREGIERMRQSILLERAHQREAAACFEAALLSGQIARANLGPARYLLAELCRRLGRRAEAARWYERALATPGLPEDLRAWAIRQRKGCRAKPGT